MRDIKKILRERILVLDGALGTMIQKYKFREDDFRGREFLKHGQPIAGFNDILNLTRPGAIGEIHWKYLEAGANIITTNTFNSNRISMRDYGLDIKDGLVERLNKEGALLAKKAIREFEEKEKKNDIHFVGGSIGPTNRSASMSPDITDPLKRNISFDELFVAYREQVKGLVEGGVDLLICETFFDTLNLKAAISAANSVMTEKGLNLPILVSATVSDNAGRILSGQTLEAFVASVENYENVYSVGLNCGFGPNRMLNYIRQINEYNRHFTSCHPNAGLPDESGCYDVGPKEFAESLKLILEKGELNIVGGCCGTTPDHIKALSEIVKDFQPRKISDLNENDLLLSGLDILKPGEEFVKIGERCNVAGSAKFLRLIKEGSFEEAAEIARKQIDAGARVIDINMDDAMLDAKEEMIKFLRYILAEPDVAKVPFMIDSSKWEVIETALKEIQGKGIVNSLSLKEGEIIFKERARKIRELGFALVVMAFDEKGQADTFERKIEISQRAYNILTKECDFKPEDIIFDVNVMTIGTGMKEHENYALDFLKSLEWIKRNLPGCKTSGGISNLSFAFRGKNKLREFMHSVFLYHAIEKGLDFAIVNPSQKIGYEDIPTNLREIIEDLILNRDPKATEKLVEYVIDIKPNQAESSKTEEDKKKPVEDLLKEDLIKGDLQHLDSHLSMAIEELKDPMKIISGPLLDGMKIVGDLFGEGKMFLPQVVKTARAMKKAVDILSPFIPSINEGGKRKGKILIATVKGDVHDIGKNIVSTILACNNYEIIDLGIMVPPEDIVAATVEESPDIICLSGLITPSLSEMTETVRQLDEAGISVPVMVGGAATSPVHTALKIAPFYSGIVIHLTDASQNPIIAEKLGNPETRTLYIEEILQQQEILRRKSHDKKKILLPFDEVRKIAEERKTNEIKCEIPKMGIGRVKKIDLPLGEIKALINWKMFFNAWKLQGKYIDSFPLTNNENNLIVWKEILSVSEREKADEALKLYKAAKDLLKEIEEESKFDGKGLIRFEKAEGKGEDLFINNQIFPMLRQQREQSDFLCVSDFIDNEKGYIGLFAVTAGRKLLQLSRDYEKIGDTFKSMLVQTLSDRIAEASAEWLHRFVRENLWSADIRPAWGYPMMPDQTLILNTKDLLPYEDIEIVLTENGAMFPPASVSGIYISNPDSKYFLVGEIGDDQITSYADKRGMTLERIKSLLRI